MAFQLIYTSAPKSLVIGRTGFSTVARTKAMNEKLASAVERCSTYDIGTGEIFSHRILSLADGTWHILTRISDAGVDYTNRNNYIAHHLILSSSEIEGLANPAEILAQWKGWKTSWNEEPRYIDSVSDLHTIKTKNSLPAKNWQDLFGNPAKAGILFDENITISALPKDARTLLNLYSESLLLNINPVNAWNTTFTTSFSTSDNPNDFMWKAIPNCDSATINLPARTAPIAPNNRASQYATTGVMNNREKLNLQVKAPTTQTQFKVVNTPPTTSSQKPIYIISAIVTIIALLTIAYILLETFLPSEQPSKAESPKPLPKLEQTINPQPVQSPQKNDAMSLLDTMTLAREKIENDKYEEALEIWDSSVYAQKNPSLRENLLADIGARIDVHLRFAENIISLQNKTDDIYKTAIDNLAKAKRAFQIQGIPRKDKRISKWNTLNEKIKK